MARDRTVYYGGESDRPGKSKKRTHRRLCAAGDRNAWCGLCCFSALLRATRNSVRPDECGAVSYVPLLPVSQLRSDAQTIATAKQHGASLGSGPSRVGSDG